MDGERGNEAFYTTSTNRGDVGNPSGFTTEQISDVIADNESSESEFDDSSSYKSFPPDVRVLPHNFTYAYR
jgi:hypothetical protein